MGRHIVSEASSNLLQSNKFQVITPTKAIASYLKVPFYSLESLSQNIVRRRGMGIASTLLSRRLLQTAVKETIATSDIEGTAKAFLPTIKDLFRSGINLVRLQQNADPRIKQLGNLAIAYQHQLRRIKRIDGGELYWQGAAEINYQKTYLFYGYFAPEQDELAIINAIAGEDSIFVLPCEGLYPQNEQGLSWLQSQGWKLRNRDDSPQQSGISEQLQQCFQGQSSLPSGVSMQVYADLDREVRGVLTQVKVLQSQGVSPQDIVLVTREEQLYGETLINLAWEYDLPIQIAYEIPLEQTRLGAWITLLLEAIKNNFPFETTAELLSHPLAQAMPAEIWSLAREKHPQGLTAWQELGVDLSLLNLPGSYSVKVWADRLLEILASWNILDNGRFWAKEIVAYYHFQSGLKELAQTEARKLTKQAFSLEIAELLNLLTIPAQPGRGGVELHNPTSILGTQYPHVFVLGCAAGILPTAIADDPVLDFYSRKQLNQQGLKIRTAIDIAQQETWNFYCLLAVPIEGLIFSYPELIDRNPTLESPYLSRLGLQPQPLDLLPLASIETARIVYLRQPDLVPHNTFFDLAKISHALLVESQRESASAQDQYDGVIGISIDPEGHIFSASQLTQIGQCPFKWFSARLLRLKELPEANLDLDAAIRGNLYHRCLELSLAEIKTAGDLTKFNQQQLAQAFATAEQELNLTELPGWQAQRQEHLNLLLLNLTTAEFLPPTREVVATETKFQMQWHGLEIQGQVDRIDRTPAGLAVIDYKTSSITPAGVKDATGKANLDLQLAIYQDAIARQYPTETIDTAAYYSLTKQKTISRPQKDPAQLEAFAKRVTKYLTSGYYPVAPDLDRKACRYCDYDLICRQGDRLSRKANLEY
ncbi:MAG: PD-(D/E)XK nuclease family protein [Cyanobacteria bacterium J06600_6]